MSSYKPTIGSLAFDSQTATSGSSIQVFADQAHLIENMIASKWGTQDWNVIDASVEEFRDRIIQRFPDRFGKVEKDTPIHDLIESISREFRDFDIAITNKMRKFNQEKDSFDNALSDFKKEKEAFFKDQKEEFRLQKKEMLNLVREIFKEKTVEQTEAFLKDLEAL